MECFCRGYVQQKYMAFLSQLSSYSIVNWPMACFVITFAVLSNFGAKLLAAVPRIPIILSHVYWLCSIFSLMLSPRGQAVVEAKILTSASKICPRPRTLPWAFVLGLSSNCLFWPRENVCNVEIGNFDSQLPTSFTVTTQDTWLSSTVKHSIRQPHLLTWTSLCLTFVFCNHSFIGCSVCQQVLPRLREFYCTVAYDVGTQSTCRMLF